MQSEESELRSALSRIEIAGSELIQNPSDWDGRVQYGPSVARMIARYFEERFVIVFQAIENSDDCRHRIPVTCPSITKIEQGNIALSSGRFLDEKLHIGPSRIYIDPRREKELFVRVQQYRAFLTTILLRDTVPTKDWSCLPKLSDDKTVELMDGFEFYHQVFLY